MLQCVAVCCNVLQCFAVWAVSIDHQALIVAACCSVLQCGQCQKTIQPLFPYPISILDNRTYSRVYQEAQAHMNSHTTTHELARNHSHTHIHTHTHTYTYAHTHAHTRTRTRTHSKERTACVLVQKWAVATRIVRCSVVLCVAVQTVPSDHPATILLLHLNSRFISVVFPYQDALKQEPQNQTVVTGFSETFSASLSECARLCASVIGCERVRRGMSESD